jgi:hypothetical protein
MKNIIVKNCREKLERNFCKLNFVENMTSLSTAEAVRHERDISNAGR